MKPHKHAAVIKAFAERAQVSETPWDIIQVMDGSYCWTDLTGAPEFRCYQIFRIKPRTININGFEVPEPVREPLANHTKYFKVELELDESFDDYIWNGDYADQLWLSLGFIHRTEEAAQLHSKALLSFTKK